MATRQGQMDWVMANCNDVNCYYSGSGLLLKMLLHAGERFW